MGVLHEIVQALWHQDFAALANPQVVWVVYGVMFATLLLENGLLPAAFLPGASRAVISAPPLGMPRSSHGTYYSASVS